MLLTVLNADSQFGLKQLDLGRLQSPLNFIILKFTNIAVFYVYTIKIIKIIEVDIKYKIIVKNYVYVIYIYICRKKKTLKNEACVPRVLSITFIAMTISIFKKCEFICDLFFTKETIYELSVSVA